jgi:hypothetical protein
MIATGQSLFSFQNEEACSSLGMYCYRLESLPGKGVGHEVTESITIDFQFWSFVPTRRVLPVFIRLAKKKTDKALPMRLTTERL